jgi:hypothetical protein
MYDALLYWRENFGASTVLYRLAGVERQHVESAIYRFNHGAKAQISVADWGKIKNTIEKVRAEK